MHPDGVSVCRVELPAAQDFLGRLLNSCYLRGIHRCSWRVEDTLRSTSVMTEGGKGGVDKSSGMGKLRLTRFGLVTDVVGAPCMVDVSLGWTVNRHVPQRYWVLGDRM